MCTDEELIILLKERNADTISILYDKYAPAIYGAILRKVNNAEIAEQILQQTFINIWYTPTVDNRYTKHLLLCMLNMANKIADDTCSVTHEKLQNLKVIASCPSGVFISVNHNE